MSELESTLSAQDTELVGEILVVEDHPIVLQAMVKMLESLSNGIQVIAAKTAEIGLTRAKHAQHLKLILLDFELPWLHGNDAIKVFYQKFPHIPIIVMSGHEERQILVGAIRSGAKAFISKRDDIAQMRQIITKAFHGELTGQEQRPSAPIDEPPRTLKDELTPRQLDVLSLMMKGYSNKEIAFHTNLAEITVKIHVSAILQTLGVLNRTQAVLLANQLGIDDGNR